MVEFADPLDSRRKETNAANGAIGYTALAHAASIELPDTLLWGDIETNTSDMQHVEPSKTVPTTPLQST